MAVRRHDLDIGVVFMAVRRYSSDISVVIIELFDYTTPRSASTYDYVDNVRAGMYPAISLQRYEYRILVFIFIHQHSIGFGISNIVARKFCVFCLDSLQWYQIQLCIDASVRVKRIARCGRRIYDYHP